MAGLLDPRQGDGSYVENRPSRGQLLWGILEPYVMGPVNAWEGLRNADLNTLLYDTGPAAQQAVGNSFDVAGALAGGSSVVPKPGNALNMGFRVFHGSPHDFPPVRLIEMADGTRLYQNMGELADTPQGARIIQEYPMGRFDLSKIGTGEGAQAYGHGLYFAEKEGIARSYRDTLSSHKFKYDNVQPDNEAAQKFSDLLSDIQQRKAKLADEDGFISIDASTDDLAALAAEEDKVRNMMVMDTINRNPHLQYGRMYEVEIDADPNAFLDWDKPLSEQPEAVRQAIQANMPEYKTRNIAGVPHVVANNRMIEVNDPDLTGRDAYILSRMGQPGGLTREQAAAASSALREAGIPGIKYLDAGSRVPSAMAKKELADWQAQLPIAEKELADATASGDKWLIGRKQAEVQRIKDGIARVSQEAEGTRNYVVFDDNLINIIRKYGIAGLLGGTAAMNAMTAEQNTQ